MDAFERLAEGLTKAAADGDRLAAWDAAGRIIARIADPSLALTPEQVKSLVWKGGAKYRWFDIAETIAGAAVQRGDAVGATRRLHAQMLMERGFSDEALARLHELLQKQLLSSADQSEAFGHIGRIHKDRFVEAARRKDEAEAREDLQRALDDGYLKGYEKDRTNIWLGINAVALLARPEAASVIKDARDTARRIALDVRAQVPLLTSAQDQMYANGTLAETYLAWDDYESALPHVKAHATNQAVNAFALGNFRRQLADVWCLSTQRFPGPEMLAYVSAAILDRQGASLQLQGSEAKIADGIRYEAVFGRDRFDSFDNYRRGLDRCSCVARIGQTAEVGVGTGFIVPGRLLSEKLDDTFVLVTNAHVLSESDDDRKAGALHPTEAVITFSACEGVPPDKEFSIGRVITASPRDQLDMCIATLSEAIAPKIPYPLAAKEPLADAQVPIRIIGHPSGGGLSLSTNRLLDLQVPKLHYSTATEGGSSGSPVFNHDWQLVGLHHAGGEAVPKLNGKVGTYAANEGIFILAIRDAVRLALA